MLADQDHEIGAGQRARRGIGGERTGVGELALHCARLHHRDLGFLSESFQRVPRLRVEHAVARHDDRPLRFANHVHGARDRLRRRMRPRLGPIARLVVEELELGGVLEPRRGDLGGEVEVHRLRHAAAQLPERVAGVLVHAPRDDQPLAVFLQSFRGRLLVTELNAAFGVFGADRHVAGDDQQRRAGGVRARDRTDHVGEARALGAGRHRDFTGDADERIGGMGHRALVPPAVGGNAGRGHGVDHGVVAGAREERRHAFFLARAREHLRAGHREVEGHRRRGLRRGEFRRHANRRNSSGCWSVLRALLGAGRSPPNAAAAVAPAPAMAFRRNDRRPAFGFGDRAS